MLFAKSFLLCAVCAVLAVAGVSPAAAQTESGAAYLSAAPDIPLAEGLNEVEEAVVFDKPEGRIVSLATLRDENFAPTDIMAFYASSLPNLGWRRLDNGPDGSAETDKAPLAVLTFGRKGEILRLTFTVDLVIFDLAPATRARR